MRDFSHPPRYEISCVLPQSSWTVWPLLMTSTVYPKMPITNYQWNSLLACLTPTNGTDRMSQNVDNKLPMKQSFLTASPLLIAPTVCPKMPINYERNSFFLDCLTLANSTDSMSLNFDNTLPTKQCFCTSWPLLIAPTVCPKMSVTNCQSTLRKIPEERR